jgi:SmpA/OmlA family protein
VKPFQYSILVLLFFGGSASRGANEMVRHDLPSMKRIHSIKAGMSKDQVRSVLGEPNRVDHETWVYFDNRAPKPGEQLTIYRIAFQGDKVQGVEKVPGPDATGPAPRSASEDELMKRALFNQLLDCLEACFQKKKISVIYPPTVLRPTSGYEQHWNLVEEVQVEGSTDHAGIWVGITAAIEVYEPVKSGIEYYGRPYIKTDSVKQKDEIEKCLPKALAAAAALGPPDPTKKHYYH